MSRARRLVEGAFKKLDEASAKADAAAIAKLTPAERERYDAWQEHTAALTAGTPWGANSPCEYPAAGGVFSIS